MPRHPCPVAIALVLCCTLTALPACEMQTRVVSEPWWNKLPVDEQPGQAHAQGQQARGTWTIPLQRFTGSDRQAEARALLTRLQQRAGIRDLWTEDVDGTATVYRGRYADPSSEEARQALHQTRRLSLDDETPFADARLSSVAGDGQPRVSDPHDLRQYPGYYTLQIGFYDAQFGDGDFREAAEDAVRALRDDDHDAYYYHGPHRSLITVGLFTYEEAFITADDPTAAQAQVDAYAPTVRELQQEFPHNLGNGLTRVQRGRDGEAQGEQHSFLVRVF